MDYRGANIHWHEGMFLQTHHFQLMDRRLALQEYEQGAVFPCNWGISYLDIDEDALQEFRVKVHRGKLKLRNGTWLTIPGNAEIAPKSFQTEVHEGEGPLSVWMGVRRIDSRRSNVYLQGEEPIGESRPFVVRDVGVEDENTGDNERVVQVKLWNARLFFGPRPDDEYEALKIGEIVRSPHSSRLIFDSKFIPPSLNIMAAPGLKERLNNISIHLNNQAAFLRKDLVEKKGDIKSEPGKILLDMMRLQIVGASGLVLRQLQFMDETHPLLIYLELSRMVGSMGALHPDIPVDIPMYNHDNLTDVMDRLMKVVWRMLEGSVNPEYMERSFEIKGERRICHIDKEWLEAELTIYLCIEADRPENEVDAILSDLRVKIGPPSRINELLSKRERGMGCQRMGRIPTGLQDRIGFHYYQLILSRQHELWDALRRDLILEIRGIPANEIPDMKIYIHNPEDDSGND